MKKIIITLALLVFAVACAHAESLTLGDKTIHYNIPSGYVLAMDGPYVQILGFMKQAMPADITVHAMYASKETDAEFRAAPEGVFLNNYFIVTSSKQLQNQKLSAKDFKEFRDFFNENHGSLTGSAMTDEINKTMDNLSGGAVQIGSVKSLGCFGETETSISFMALITQALNLEDRQMVVEQAMVSTSLLLDGKMVTVNQYKLVERPEDVTSFRDYSQVVIENMAFSNNTDGPAQNMSSASQQTPSSSSGGLIVIIIVVVVIVIVVGAIIVLRKKKN